MTFKKNVITCVALCITAILVIALCGCEDLGAYEDTTEYYGAFGDVVMIDGASKNIESYLVEEYFYNEESRENFLVDDDGVYNGIEHGKYVYMAIPFEKEVEIDSFALFMQSQEDISVYINFYVVDDLPSNWRLIGDTQTGGTQTGGTQTGGTQTGGTQTGDAQTGDAQTGGTQTGGTQTGDAQTGGTQTGDAQTGGTQTGDAQTGDAQTGGNQTNGETSGDGSGNNAENEKPSYDDPTPEDRVGEIVIHLKKEEWNSFVLEYFAVDGSQRESIKIKETQYLLLQIRNNSGVRIFDNENKVFVDPQTGLVLEEANITATNLLIRALDIKDGNEEQGGE